MLGLENPYAQTNVQLFEQLRSEGYTGEERARVADAYEFAMKLFTGIYLPSGKPFIDHLVGTASILASLHMPVEVVAAGLIHAAYFHGDFGGMKKGAFEKNRKLVRETVGEEIEDYVERYDRLSWGPEMILSLHDGVNQLSQVERKVLLIRLANELEHELDLGGFTLREMIRTNCGTSDTLKPTAQRWRRWHEHLGTPCLPLPWRRCFGQ